MTQSPSPGEGSSPPEITFGDIGSAAWRKLREMRTAFQILVAIAIAALICAIVPQNEPVEQYAARYGKALGNLIVGLGLNHVHSAVWFVALLGLLLLSLAACSRRLWNEAAMRWRLPTAGSAALKVKGSKRPVDVAPVGTDEALSRVEKTVRRHGYRTVALGQDGEQTLLYIHKHRFSAWGQTMAHYAVFLIALGSLLGAFPGVSLDQNIDIQEGDTYHSTDQALPFDIKVTGFRIVQNPDSQDVQNYYSDVELVSGGQTVAHGTISVNHPLKYHGYFISQSSWSLGEARVLVNHGAQTERVAYPLERTGCPGPGGSPNCWGVPQDSSPFFLSDGHSALVATDFFADAKTEGGKVVGRDTEYPGNPALKLLLVSGLPGQAKKPQGPAEGAPKHGMADVGWLFPGQARPLADGGEVKFVGITKTTGLGIRKDVGLPLVWAGFIASILGLILIFYFPLQRSIVSCESRGTGQTALTMGSYGRSGDLVDGTDELWSEVLANLAAKPTTKPGAKPREDASND